MRTQRIGARGFTLIELLITVSIIGILAAVGVPIYKHYVQRSRNAETPMGFAKIRAGEEAYKMVQNRYLPLAYNPCTNCTLAAPKQKFAKQTSDDANCTGTGIYDYSQFWGRDGVDVQVAPRTYFNYMVTVGQGAWGSCTSSLNKNHQNYYGTYPTLTNRYLVSCTLVQAGTNLNDADDRWWYVIQARGDHVTGGNAAIFHQTIDMERLYEQNEVD